MTERKREQKQPKYPTLVSFYRNFESGKRPLKLMRVIMTESTYSVGREGGRGGGRQKKENVESHDMLLYNISGSGAHCFAVMMKSGPCNLGRPFAIQIGTVSCVNLGSGFSR